MKKHTDYRPGDAGVWTTPKPGEFFTFHGALIKTVSSDRMKCVNCAARKLQRVGEASVCHELPQCDGVTFIYRRIEKPREFKTWQVIRRMGLDDET